MAAKGKFLDAVIEMRVDDEVLIDRISGRFTCSNCGEVYHDTTKPTARAGFCDKCGGTEFIRRADDNPDAVRVRLMAYYRQTAPLIGYYHAKGKLRAVDGLDPSTRFPAEIRTLLGLNKPGLNPSTSRRAIIYSALSPRESCSLYISPRGRGMLGPARWVSEPAEGIGGLWLLDGGPEGPEDERRPTWRA